jgi:hypothetical protein
LLLAQKLSCAQLIRPGDDENDDARPLARRAASSAKSVDGSFRTPTDKNRKEERTFVQESRCVPFSTIVRVHTLDTPFAHLRVLNSMFFSQSSDFGARISM